MLSTLEFDYSLLQDNIFSEENEACTSGEDSVQESSDAADNSDECGSGRENAGRWTNEEHDLFLEGFRLHGKGWKKIAALIKSRSVIQVRTHAQKYFLKMSKAKQNGVLCDIPMDGSLSTGTGPKKRHSSSGDRQLSKKNKLRKNSLDSQSTESEVAPALTIGIGSLLYENPKLKDDSHSCISPLSVTELEPYTINTPVAVAVLPSTGIMTDKAFMVFQNQIPECLSAPNLPPQPLSVAAPIPIGKGQLFSSISNDVDYNFDMFTNGNPLTGSGYNWDSAHHHTNKQICPDNDKSKLSCLVSSSFQEYKDETDGQRMSSTSIQGLSSIASSSNIQLQLPLSELPMDEQLYSDSMFLGLGMGMAMGSLCMSSNPSEVNLSLTSHDNSFSFGLLNDSGMDESDLDDELFTQDLLALNDNFSSPSDTDTCLFST